MASPFLLTEKKRKRTDDDILSEIQTKEKEDLNVDIEIDRPEKEEGSQNDEKEREGESVDENAGEEKVHPYVDVLTNRRRTMRSHWRAWTASGSTTTTIAWARRKVPTRRRSFDCCGSLLAMDGPYCAVGIWVPPKEPRHLESVEALNRQKNMLQTYFL